MENQVLDDQLINKKNGEEAINLVSPKQFVFLTIFTLGLYPVWWNFKAWRFFKIHGGQHNISPALRTIFSVAYNYSLFESVREYANGKGYGNSFNALFLFILSACLYLISNFAPEGSPWVFSSLFVGFVYIPIIKAYNYAITNDDFISSFVQSRLNIRQITLVVIGGLLIACVFLSLLGNNTPEIEPLLSE